MNGERHNRLTDGPCRCDLDRDETEAVTAKVEDERAGDGVAVGTGEGRWGVESHPVVEAQYRADLAEIDAAERGHSAEAGDDLRALERQEGVIKCPTCGVRQLACFIFEAERDRWCCGDCTAHQGSHDWEAVR